MLEISALGYPLIIRRDGRAIKVPKKARALLVYLACHQGRRVSRERLADLLWPYQAPEQARHSLRNCLTELRKSVGDIDELRGFTEIGLPSETVHFDAALLKERASAADVSAVASLYRGPFLDDFWLNSDPWTEWVADERLRLQDITVQALEEAAAQALTDNNPERAIATAERLLAIDRLHEPAHRIIITAQRACGRNGSAVRQYHACTRMLRQELGAVPSAATSAAAKGLSALTPPILSRAALDLLTECHRLGLEARKDLAGEDGRKPGRRRFSEMTDLLLSVATIRGDNNNVRDALRDAA